MFCVNNSDEICVYFNSTQYTDRLLMHIHIDRFLTYIVISRHIQNNDWIQPPRHWIFIDGPLINAQTRCLLLKSVAFFDPNMLTLHSGCSSPKPLITENILVWETISYSSTATYCLFRTWSISIIFRMTGHTEQISKLSLVGTSYMTMPVSHWKSKHIVPTPVLCWQHVNSPVYFPEVSQ